MISLNNIVTTDEITDEAVTTAKIDDLAVTGAKIANSTIDLATKATTLTSLTLPSLKTDRLPFWHSFAITNTSAGLTNRVLPTKFAAGFAPSVIIAALPCTIVGYAVNFDSTPVTSAENAHDNAEYTGWTAGTIGIDLASSPNGTNAMSQVAVGFTGLTKATVDAWPGRWTKFNITALGTPVTIPAGSEVVCRITTSAGFDGTGLEITIVWYGYLSTI